MTKQAATTCAPAEPQQLRRRGRRATGGDQIVEQQHLLATHGWHPVHFHLVDTVFERIGDATVSCGNLPRLRIGTNPAARPMRHGSTQNETPRFDAGNLVDSASRHGAISASMVICEGARIAQQRGDVTELDPRLGVIGDGPNRLPEK